jgi:hypothetical protein
VAVGVGLGVGVAVGVGATVGVGVGTGHFRAGGQDGLTAAVIVGIASAVRSAMPARPAGNRFTATSCRTLARPLGSRRERCRTAANQPAAARHGGDGPDGQGAEARAAGRLTGLLSAVTRRSWGPRSTAITLPPRRRRGQPRERGRRLAGA